MASVLLGPVGDADLRAIRQFAAQPLVAMPLIMRGLRRGQVGHPRRAADEDEGLRGDLRECIPPAPGEEGEPGGEAAF